MPCTSSAQLEHGKDHLMLFIDDMDVGKVQRVEVYWNYNGGLLHPCTLLCNNNLYVSSIEISELSNYPETARLDHTYRNCALNAAYGDINSGNTVAFYPTAC